MKVAHLSEQAEGDVVFSDGLGVRVRALSEAGEQVQRFTLHPAFTPVQAAVQERVTRLTNLQHVKFGRIRGFERAPKNGAPVIILSDVEGRRLSDVLQLAGHGLVTFDAGPALQVTREVLAALTVLHDSRNVTHGSLAPERVVLTPHGRVVVVEHVLSQALDKLQLPRHQLWRDWRIATPPAAGPVRFDARTDLAQAGLLVLALVLGRPIEEDEYPHKLRALLPQVQQRLARSTASRIARDVQVWLERLLPIESRHPFTAVKDAQLAFESLVTSSSSLGMSPAKVKAVLTACAALEVPAPASAEEATQARAEAESAAASVVTPIVQTSESVVEEPPDASAPATRVDDLDIEALLRLAAELDGVSDAATGETPAGSIPAAGQDAPLPVTETTPAEASPADDILIDAGVSDAGAAEVVVLGKAQDAPEPVALVSPRALGVEDNVPAAEAQAVQAPAGLEDLASERVELQQRFADLLAQVAPTEDEPPADLPPPGPLVQDTVRWTFEPQPESAADVEPVAWTAGPVAADVVADGNAEADAPALPAVPATAAEADAIASEEAVQTSDDAASLFEVIASAPADVSPAPLADAAAGSVEEPGVPPAAETLAETAEEARAEVPAEVEAEPAAALASEPRAFAGAVDAWLFGDVGPVVDHVGQDGARDTDAADAGTDIGAVAVRDNAAHDDAQDLHAQGDLPLGAEAVAAVFAAPDTDDVVESIVHADDPVATPVLEPTSAHDVDATEVAGGKIVEAADGPGSALPEVPALAVVHEPPPTRADGPDAVFAEEAASALVDEPAAEVVEAPATAALVEDVVAATVEEADALLADTVVPALDDVQSAALDDTAWPVAEVAACLETLEAVESVAAVEAEDVSEATAVPDVARVVETSGSVVEDITVALAPEAVDVVDAAPIEAASPMVVGVAEAVSNDVLAETSDPDPDPAPAPVLTAEAAVDVEPVVVAAAEPAATVPEPETPPVAAPAVAAVAAAPPGRTTSRRKRSRRRGKKSVVAPVPAAAPTPAPTPPPAAAPALFASVAPPVPDVPAASPVAALVPEVAPSRPAAPAASIMDRDVPAWQPPPDLGAVHAEAARRTVAASQADPSNSRPEIPAPVSVEAVAPARDEAPMAALAPVPALMADIGGRRPTLAEMADASGVAQPAPVSAVVTGVAEAVPPVPMHAEAPRPRTIVVITRGVNWRRTAAAAVLLAILESAAFAAAWWWVKPGAKGTLVVQTSVPGVEVLVDGKRVGHTPFQDDLRPGRHTLTLRRGGLERNMPVEISLGVVTTQTLSWPDATTGALRVTSTPDGADVVVDGRVRGRTPLTIDGLAVGRRTVLVRSQSGTVSASAAVVAGETVTLDVPIFAGWVHVHAPVDLTVSVNGTRVGSSLDGQILLAPGTHQIEVVSDALGFRDTMQATVEPGKVRNVTVTLPTVPLAVTDEDGAEVFVDGVSQGMLPDPAISIPLGTHEIVLRRADGSERRRTLTVRVGTPVSLD